MPRDYGITLELLQEYNANKPILGWVQNLKQQLADTEEKLHKCEQDLENEKIFDKLGEELMWSISGNELDKASMELALVDIPLRVGNQA